jgi:hypothetical protein
MRFAIPLFFVIHYWFEEIAKFCFQLWDDFNKSFYVKPTGGGNWR